MSYGKENHYKASSSSYSLPSPKTQQWLLTCAARVPIEAQGTLVAGVPCKIHMASALASWAAVVVHRTPGIAGASCKSRESDETCDLWPSTAALNCHPAPEELAISIRTK